MGITQAHEIPSRAFKFPNEEPMPDLSKFLERDVCDPPQLPTAPAEQSNYVKCAAKLIDTHGGIVGLKALAIGDLGNGFKSVALGDGFAPCLTRAHCGGNYYYSFYNQRKLKLTEYFMLQGIPPNRLKVPVDVGERQVKLMIGNSFAVPMIAAILDRAMYAAGLTDRPIKFTPGTGEDGNSA